jgi:hypothetical protein
MGFPEIRNPKREIRKKSEIRSSNPVLELGFGVPGWFRISIFGFRVFPCLVLLTLAAAQPASACSIPVFRYALERWELSPYELVVFHRGGLSAADQAFLDGLPRKANLAVTLVDVAGEIGPALRGLWEQQGKPAELPWAVLRPPVGDPKASPIWSGPLEPAKLSPVLDSPARHKIVSALCGGDTGVFVLLLSGDPAADEAARGLLQKELAALEKLVKLPEQRDDGPRIRLALPLRVGFTVLPLRRDAPGEAALVRMLLGSEAGLDRVAGPIAFPVFGRGRVLGSLYGKDLDADNLFEVVSFLCGECSCQVKELNPGVDLLIAADWGATFERIGPVAHAPGPEDEAAPAPTLPSPASHREANPVVLASPPPAAPAAVAPHRRWLWAGVVAAALLFLATGIWACSQRSRPAP